jgi:hypothetical protein
MLGSVLSNIGHSKAGYWPGSTFLLRRIGAFGFLFQTLKKIFVVSAKHCDCSFLFCTVCAGPRCCGSAYSGMGGDARVQDQRSRKS